jgi:hypothetical protein
MSEENAALHLVVEQQAASIAELGVHIADLGQRLSHNPRSHRGLTTGFDPSPRANHHVVVPHPGTGFPDRYHLTSRCGNVQGPEPILFKDLTNGTRVRPYVPVPDAAQWDWLSLAEYLGDR